jgi:hypothetical protein
MNTTHPTDINLITNAIGAELRKEVEARYEILKKEMIERLDRDKDIIIAGLVLHLQKTMLIETHGERIVIELRTKSL